MRSTRSSRAGEYGPARSSSVPSSRECGLVGGAVGLLVSSAALIVVAARNPFFLDRLDLGLALFFAVPLVVGAALGILLCLARRIATTSKRSRGERPGSRRAVPFLAVAGCLALVITGVAWGLSWRAERVSSDRSLKLLLVVIDGATWDVAQPMIERGELRNLASAIEAGSSGVLTSRRPMYSPIIYTSLASGKVADKHGIRGPEDYTSDAVLVERVWDILGAALGWEYGVVEWHATCPPHASPAGFMVPGWLATTNETVPRELSFLKMIRRSGRAGKALGGVGQIKVALAAAWNGARLSTLVDLARIAAISRFGNERPVALNLMQHKAFVPMLTEVTRFQLQRRSVDMLAIAYTSTDAMSHRFWRFHEPDIFPDTDPEAVERYGSVIEDVYAAVDEQLGLLTRYLSEDGLLFIVSDHGFQAEPQPYAQPRVLRTEALLQFIDVGLDEVTYFNQGVGGSIRPVATDEAANSKMRELVERACAALVMKDTGSRAFYVENKDRPGTGDDYVQVRATDALQRATLSNDVVVAPSGAEAAASDLLLVFENTGWHALDGLIIVDGEPFKEGARIDSASVLDVTPTILAALGLPVARDMDGAVIEDAMTDSFLSAHPVTVMDSYEPESPRSRERRTRQPLPEELRDRLRALGYVQ